MYPVNENMLCDYYQLVFGTIQCDTRVALCTIILIDRYIDRFNHITQASSSGMYLRLHYGNCRK
jgi:hypothetical protein